MASLASLAARVCGDGRSADGCEWAAAEAALDHYLCHCRPTKPQETPGVTAQCTQRLRNVGWGVAARHFNERMM
eukprot:gene48023-50415_t